ncbi:glycosyltransferase family 4 protein [Patescibacteria group bacterium]|nr:glycosyltransferase family 4 protein [Patescibacteria group bacterium]
MKIGVDIRSLEKQPSGVSIYLEKLLENLFNIDQQNQYYLFYNAFSQSADSVKEKFNYPNCHFCFSRTPNKIFNFKQTFLRSPKIDQLIGEIDLFFMPNLNFAAISRKTDLVITVHDLSYQFYPSLFTLKRRLWHSFVYPKLLFKKAKLIIAVSANTKKDLIDVYKIPDSKIKVIYSGIDQAETNQPRKNTRALPDLADNFILSLCNLEPRKNIESIILAFDQIKRNGYQGQLVICGKPGWSYKNIYKLAKKSPFCQSIKFLGYVDDEDKKNLLVAADLLVYPSFYEGFGFPPLEAMAAGTPVITSYNSSLPEVVKDLALLIDPYNLTELVKAIEVSLDNIKEKDDVADLGTSNSQKFTWQQTAGQTLELFESLSP